jgi:hypothetical protein
MTPLLKERIPEIMSKKQPGIVNDIGKSLKKLQKKLQKKVTKKKMILRKKRKTKVMLLTK